MKIAFTLLAAALIAGCATSGKIKNVALGMTKSEVIAVMGKPVSVSAKGSSEYLNYALSETDDDAFSGITNEYYVRLIDGIVDSYGRTGDFDSTQPPTVRIETDENASVDSESDLYTELRKLKALHDEGILSDDEYERLKQKAIAEY